MVMTKIKKLSLLDHSVLGNLVDEMEAEAFCCSMRRGMRITRPLQ